MSSANVSKKKAILPELIRCNSFLVPPVRVTSSRPRPLAPSAARPLGPDHLSRPCGSPPPRAARRVHLRRDDRGHRPRRLRRGTPSSEQDIGAGPPHVRDAAPLRTMPVRRTPDAAPPVTDAGPPCTPVDDELGSGWFPRHVRRAAVPPEPVPRRSAGDDAGPPHPAVDAGPATFDAGGLPRDGPDAAGPLSRASIRIFLLLARPSREHVASPDVRDRAASAVSSHRLTANPRGGTCRWLGTRDVDRAAADSRGLGDHARVRSGVSRLAGGTGAPDELTTEQAFDLVDRWRRSAFARAHAYRRRGVPPRRLDRDREAHRGHGMQCGSRRAVVVSPPSAPRRRTTREFGARSPSLRDGLRETHDKLRGLQGSWESAMNAITNLREAGIAVARTRSSTRRASARSPRC